MKKIILIFTLLAPLNLIYASNRAQCNFLLQQFGEQNIEIGEINIKLSFLPDGDEVEGDFLFSLYQLSLQRSNHLQSTITELCFKD